MEQKKILEFEEIFKGFMSININSICFTCFNNSVVIDNRYRASLFLEAESLDNYSKLWGQHVTTASFRHVVCVWWSTSQFSFSHVKALLPRWIRQNGLTDFPYIISFTRQKFNLNVTPFHVIPIFPSSITSPTLMIKNET